MKGKNAAIIHIEVTNKTKKASDGYFTDSSMIVHDVSAGVLGIASMLHTFGKNIGKSYEEMLEILKLYEDVVERIELIEEDGDGTDPDAHID